MLNSPKNIRSCTQQTENVLQVDVRYNDADYTSSDVVCTYEYISMYLIMFCYAAKRGIIIVIQQQQQQQHLTSPIYNNLSSGQDAFIPCLQDHAQQKTYLRVIIAEPVRITPKVPIGEGCAAGGSTATGACSSSRVRREIGAERNGRLKAGRKRRRGRSDIVSVFLGVHLNGTSLRHCCDVLVVCVRDGAALRLFFCAF